MEEKIENLNYIFEGVETMYLKQPELFYKAQGNQKRENQMLDQVVELGHLINRLDAFSIFMDEFGEDPNLSVKVSSKSKVSLKVRDDYVRVTIPDEYFKGTLDDDPSLDKLLEILKEVLGTHMEYHKDQFKILMVSRDFLEDSAEDDS